MNPESTSQVWHASTELLFFFAAPGVVVPGLCIFCSINEQVTPVNKNLPGGKTESNTMHRSTSSMVGCGGAWITATMC